MRVVIQRVQRASVHVEDRCKAQIEHGLLLLVGIEVEDGMDDVRWITNKIAKMRIFNDTNGKMNLSINDVGGQILAISQFTLYASTKKGNRPSFIKAAKPDISLPLYRDFIQTLDSVTDAEVQQGEFGADMKVSLINDGPVTILIDSKNKE